MKKLNACNGTFQYPIEADDVINMVKIVEKAVIF